jgi:methylmalonyl-CoA/ethylmalonyl-CoA epimerase
MGSARNGGTMKRLIIFAPLIFLCCFSFSYQQSEKAAGKPMGDSDTSSWQLTQVGVVVKDVKQVAERLAYLGIGPFQEMKLPADRQELFRGKPALADAKIMGATLGGIQLELIQPLAKESPHREFLETKGEGIQHIMVVVDDIEKEIKRLTDKGCTVLLDIRMPGGRHGAYIDLNAGGIILEMFQKRPNQK